jgi:hypothetical protein
MNAVYEALVSLSPVHDAEMLEGHQRYATLLETLLTPEQLATYADLIRRTGEIRIFEEMTMDELAVLTPQERAIAEAVMADQNACMENRRVVALLNQRGEHEVAPDLGAAVARS